MSALVQEKGWTSKHPQHTGKQNPKEQKTTKGDPKGDVEFQLVFAKDIKEHQTNVVTIDPHICHSCDQV